MGRIKEQYDQSYFNKNNMLSVVGSDGLEQPSFIGLIDIIKSLGSLSEAEVNSNLVVTEFEIEEYNPNQLRFFTSEAI